METNYYTIKVYQQRDGSREIRTLLLDHLIHSEVDPEDSSYLHYKHEHIQMEFLWAARRGIRSRALVVGGGRLHFPRYAMEMLPETRMDVVEIDPV